MVKSMTGYGRGEAQGDRKKFIVEMKSVNHRFSEVFIRMPKGYALLEEKVRKLVLAKIARGRIDVFVTAEEMPGDVKHVEVDTALAEGYRKALAEIAGLLGKGLEVTPRELAVMTGVMTLREPEEDIEATEAVLSEAGQAALGKLVEMRAAEGATLKVDLLHRIEKIEHFNSEIKARSPRVVDEYRERLSQRLTEILQAGAVDENRLAAEVAIYADRSNITEETVRLASHLDQFRKTLELAEPVGRKLDFMVQELNREVNTMGSKSGDIEITNLVLSAKSEIEKIREQVQNIE